MIVSSPEKMEKLRTIDKQLFFCLGHSRALKGGENWKMTLRSLAIRTRVFKQEGTGVEIWCNLKDFRKALKKYNFSFLGFLLEFGAEIRSGSVKLPTGVKNAAR